MRKLSDIKGEEALDVLAEILVPITAIANDEEVKKGLQNLGINYSIDKRIVRGLDYYTKTVFEFVSNSIGAQSAVCGGGRYDGLISECGGKETPGIGFAIGQERLLMLLDSQNINIQDTDRVDLYIASVDDTRSYVQKLAYDLRCNGLSVSYDLLDKSLKGQMKYADKIKARYSIVIGENETTTGTVVLKNMENSDKKDIQIEDIKKELQN